MTRIAGLTGATLETAPTVCHDCIWWQSKTGRRIDKRKWIAGTEEEWGAWGTVYYDNDGRLLGSMQYGPADLFPRRIVGSVAGLVGFGGAMGGVVFNLVVGYLLDHGFGYETVFALVGTFHVAAFGLILLTVRRVEPLSLPSVEMRVSARIAT